MTEAVTQFSRIHQKLNALIATESSKDSKDERKRRLHDVLFNSSEKG